jgi:hypothetical protein
VEVGDGYRACGWQTVEELCGQGFGVVVVVKLVQDREQE